MNKEKGNKGNSLLTKKWLQAAFWLAALFLFFYFLASPAQDTQKKIALTQIVSEINADKVQKIIVNDNELEVFYIDGEGVQAVKEPDISLTESLSGLGADAEKIKNIEIEFQEKNDIWSWLLPIALGILPPILILFVFWGIFKQAKTGAMRTLDFTQTKAKLFGVEGKREEKTSFDDVAGLKEAKEELREIIDFLKNPKKFFQIGAKIPRGVLLVGAPGTGKTLLARAVANEANVPFFSISGSEFIEMFVGVGASRIRSVFAQAKKAGHAILFIDEIDSIGHSRNAGFGGGFEEREQTLNQILAEMDGFERDSQVIVMGATNKPESLDSALLRPGRFDRRVVLDLPDIEDRENVLKIHCRKKPLAADVNLKEIAERTPGFSGADLESLANEAAILAARRNKKEILQQEFLESIEKVLLGPERKSHILNKKEKEIAAFHEAGHALAAASLSDAGEVRKISIIARGLAAGYTLKMPKEEKKLQQKSELLSELTILLGGYTAEKMKFGEMTTGAADDLKKASHLARELVKKYGMSSLGPIVFGERQEFSFLPTDSAETVNYSEATAAAIDQEVIRFINEAERKALDILKEKKQVLEKLAATLIEKETIEKQEFEKIIQEG